MLLSLDKLLRMAVHVVQVNILALCVCTREAVKLMRDRQVDDGCIINICRFVLKINKSIRACINLSNLLSVLRCLIRLL